MVLLHARLHLYYACSACRSTSEASRASLPARMCAWHRLGTRHELGAVYPRQLVSSRGVLLLPAPSLLPHALV